MKFSIGDKIVLKRTDEEGVVVGFIGKDMLEVEVNGTHFPVYMDEVDHPYLKWFTEKSKQKKKAYSLPEQLPVEKEKQRPPKLSRGIYLSFMPVYQVNEAEDVVEKLKIYLLNETPVPIRFSYDIKILHQSDFTLEGTLHPFGNLYLHSVDYGDMNDQPRFHWELADAGNPALKTEEGVLRIKPAKLFKHINELLLKNEPMFAYLLVEDFVLKPKEEKRQTLEMPARQARQPKTSKITSLADLPRYEIDLHIEQLISDYQGLSNSEMMNVQLDTLHRYLQLAIVHRQEKMIIIHGMGTGALREAVHQVLRDTPEVASFRNEYMAKYGFGATEVFFKR